jgi:hypothetical protein
MSKTTKAPIDSAALDTLIEQLDKYRVDPKAKRLTVDNAHTLSTTLRNAKTELDAIMSDPYEKEEEETEVEEKEAAAAKKK